MKKITTILLMMCGFVWNTEAQMTANFESFNLGIDTFLNGSDGSGGFSDGHIFLPNAYNVAWASWSGWSVSAMTDTLTAGYTNDLSVIAGTGYNSTTYATAYIVDAGKIHLDSTLSRGPVGFYINNSTYAYLSMRDGDGFAKKFGGITGDDADFFLLTIKKYYNGVLGMDSVNFYLADFRFSDNSQDYIVKDWEYVDLTSLGYADSLIFTLQSSDNGVFGMNTPSYFCIDNFMTINRPVSTSFFKASTLQIFPNPTTDFIVIEGLELTSKAQYVIIDRNGRLIENNYFYDDNRLLVSHLKKGIYFITVIDEGRKVSNSFSVF